MVEPGYRVYNQGTWGKSLTSLSLGAHPPVKWGCYFCIPQNPDVRMPCKLQKAYKVLALVIIIKLPTDPVYPIPWGRVCRTKRTRQSETHSPFPFWAMPWALGIPESLALNGLKPATRA